MNKEKLLAVEAVESILYQNSDLTAHLAGRKSPRAVASLFDGIAYSKRIYKTLLQSS
jgi:hypothetical protein